MTRRVFVRHIQRLGELAFDGFGAFSVGTKPSAMTGAATVLGQSVNVHKLDLFIRYRRPAPRIQLRRYQ